MARRTRKVKRSRSRKVRRVSRKVSRKSRSRRVSRKSRKGGRKRKTKKRVSRKMKGGAEGIGKEYYFKDRAAWQPEKGEYFILKGTIKEITPGGVAKMGDEKTAWSHVYNTREDAIENNGITIDSIIEQMSPEERERRAAAIAALPESRVKIEAREAAKAKALKIETEKEQQEQRRARQAHFNKLDPDSQAAYDLASWERSHGK